MEYQHLLLDHRDGCVTITLNRPEKLNAIHRDMFMEIGAAMDEIIEMPEVCSVVIKGSGRAFSAGGDMSGMGGHSGRRTLSAYRYHLYQTHEIFHRIERLEKPVIARIHGFAYGGGLELALACDFRIAAEDAKFSLPEVLIGIMPDLGGCQRLVNTVGVPRAKELAMTARVIDGKEAERINLVHKATRPEELDGAVQAWVDTFSTLPPLAVGTTKRVIDKCQDMDLMSSLDLNWGLQTFLTRTEDYQEGVQSRREKRSPVFKGS